MAITISIGMGNQQNGQKLLLIENANQLQHFYNNPESKLAKNLILAKLKII